MNWFRSALTLTGLTALSRFLGFVRDIVITAYLGAGPQADAFYAAFRLPNLFRRLFAEGAFQAVFVPTFSHVLNRHGQQHARYFTFQAVLLLTVILGALVIMVEGNADKILYIVTPGFFDTPDRLAYALPYMQIMFPYILLISLAALFTSILNTFHYYTVGALAPIIMNIGMIGILLGPQKYFANPGQALSWAVIVTGFLHLIMTLGNTLAIGYLPQRTSLKIMPELKKMLVLLGPALLGAGIMQLNGFISTIFLSQLPVGAITYFSLADRLNQLPISLVGITISTIMLPYMSNQIATQALSQAQELQEKILSSILFLAIPIAVLLGMTSYMVVAFLFAGPKFTPEDITTTATVLSLLCIGMPAHILGRILSTSFFARQNTNIPLIAGIISVLINISGCLIMQGQLTYYSIGLILAIASWANVSALFYFCIKANILPPNVKWLEKLVPIATATIVVMLFLSWSTAFAKEIEHRLLLGLMLAGIGIISIIVYCLVHYLCGGHELRYLQRFYYRKKNP